MGENDILPSLENRRVAQAILAEEFGVSGRLVINRDYAIDRAAISALGLKG